MRRGIPLSLLNWALSSSGPLRSVSTGAGVAVTWAPEAPVGGALVVADGGAPQAVNTNVKSNTRLAKRGITIRLRIDPPACACQHEQASCCLGGHCVSP